MLNHYRLHVLFFTARGNQILNNKQVEYSLNRLDIWHRHKHSHCNRKWITFHTKKSKIKHILSKDYFFHTLSLNGT